MWNSNKKGPGAPVRAPRAEVVVHQDHTSEPLIPLEAYVLGAIAVFPEARARVRKLGIAPIYLCTRKAAALLADALIDESTTVRDALAAVGTLPETLSCLREAVEAVKAMEHADGPAWGVRVVERLAEERALEWAPLTLKWAAEALERGWASPMRVRAEVDRVLALAAGEPVGEVAA